MKKFDQFTAIRPSYFHRRGVCDMFPMCFRPSHTMIYAFDAAGLETPVLCLCSVHSGTKETELLPFEKLNERMVREAMTLLFQEQANFDKNDVIKKLNEIGYGRQVNWAETSEITALMSFILVKTSIRGD